MKPKISLTRGLLPALLSMSILQGCSTVPTAPQSAIDESPKPELPQRVEVIEQPAINENTSPAAEPAAAQRLTVAAVGDIR